MVKSESRVPPHHTHAQPAHSFLSAPWRVYGDYLSHTGDGRSKCNNTDGALGGAVFSHLKLTQVSSCWSCARRDSTRSQRNLQYRTGALLDKQVKV